MKGTRSGMIGHVRQLHSNLKCTTPRVATRMLTLRLCSEGNSLGVFALRFFPDARRAPFVRTAPIGRTNPPHGKPRRRLRAEGEGMGVKRAMHAAMPLGCLDAVHYYDAP